MEIKELKSRIAKSTNTQWFSEVITRISLPYINYEREFTGVASIYEFSSKGIAFWESLGTGLPGDFQASKQYFEQIINQIDNILGNYSEHSPAQLNGYWQSWIQGNLNAYENQRPIPFDTPEAIFLEYVYKNYGNNQAAGAYNFITRGILENSGNKERLIGGYLGMQFSSENKIKAFSLLQGEKKNISRLTASWEKLILEGTNNVSAYIKATNEKFEEYSKSIDSLKKEKENTFNTWFSQAEAAKIGFESTYKKLLELKEPAKYWTERAFSLRIQGWIFTLFLGLFVALAGLILSELLFSTPEEFFENLFGTEDKIPAIRWSIIFITFIGFIGYIIKILSRAMFSSFHLARDSEERATLASVYLALNNETTVEKEDRLIILQSIFGRSDSGLLNTDTSIALPTINLK